MSDFGRAIIDKARELQENDYSSLPYWDYRREEWAAQRARDNQERAYMEHVRRAHGGSLYDSLEAMDRGGRDFRQEFMERQERGQLEAARQIVAARGCSLYEALEALGAK